jgi:hypothetical protein
MTRFSLAIGAAAAAIVLVSSLMLTRPSSPSVVGTTPSPASLASPSASASAPAVPTDLRDRWMGGHRGFVELNKGSNLVFTSDNFVMTQSDQWDFIEFLNSTASAAGDGQLRLELTANDNGCETGDVGLYSWSLSPSGHTLTITADQDDCAARSSAVPGVWWLAGCPNELCLGILDAGTYKSQYITPRLDPGAAWEPEFGGLTYTVPEGWANSNDSPGSYELVPAPEMPPVAETDRRRNIGIFTQPTAMTQDKPCSDKIQPGVGRTVSALTTWLQTVPGLIATAPKSITIDGHPGQWLDLRRDPSWTKTCDGSTEPLVTFLNPGIAVGADQRVRLILLDLGGGDVVATGVWTRDQATLDAFIPEAMPVIESFHYE